MSGGAACFYYTCVCTLSELSIQLKCTSSYADTCCGIYCAVLKIFGLLRLWEKPDVKTNCDGADCQADEQARMIARVGMASLRTTQAPSHRKPFVILKCIFMNNSYFHFTLLWFLILMKRKYTQKQVESNTLWRNSAKLPRWKLFQKLRLPVWDVLSVCLSFDWLGASRDELLLYEQGASRCTPQILHKLLCQWHY